MVPPTFPPFTHDNRPFEPRGAARLALRSRRRELVLSGPAGTGKSTAILQKLHLCAQRFPRLRALIVRKTRHSLTQSAMVTYEQKVLPEGWLGNIVHFRTTEQQYEYPNGSIIAVGGLDKPSKVMSSEFDIIAVIEATELSEDAWEALTTRLRNGVMDYQQLIADCNPGAPTHWLKQRCDRGVTLMFESRHEDNPSVTQEYLAALRSLTGVRKLRLCDGRWAAAEGLVYDEFDRAIHLVSKRQLIAWGVLNEDETINREVIRRVIAGTDWGYRNPGSITVWGLDGDDRMYLLREVYRTRRDIDWWKKQAKALKKEYGISRFICDPSEPAYIEQFNKAGLTAEKATNDIAPGISAVKERLKDAGDGRPRFFVYEHALQERDEERDEAHLPCGLLEEIDEYVWDTVADGKLQKEIPVAVHNHSLDSMRYTAMWLIKPKVSGGIIMPSADEEEVEQSQPGLIPGLSWIEAAGQINWW